ncbi:AMP-binding protein [Marinicrinis sediminis]|uniref:AMP-binding protein n=1 Tax=Marinicrinis sediminis TaxID=1652465 RepID=A0ABW5RA50_9BACL
MSPNHDEQVDKQIDRKIRQACQAFPWLQQLLEQEGQVNLNQPLQASDLIRCPWLTAERLQPYYEGDFSHLGTYVYRTSGTSGGKRKAIWYSESDEEQYIAIKTKLFRSLVKDFGHRRVTADMGTGHAAYTSTVIFKALGMEVDAIDYTWPVQAHIDRLQAFKPTLLYTMPSILERLADHLENPQELGLKQILLVGEMASPAWQQRMAERFGLPAMSIQDTYGSIEIGTIAYYDHRTGRYQIVEGIFAEGLSASGAGEELAQLGPDEQILVLTSWVRDAFPALRFVTYDVVRDLRTEWRDGRWVQSFSAIVKRVGPELKHGEKISLYDIERVIYRHLKEATIRVKMVQRQLQVHVRCHPLSEEEVTAIQTDLHACMPEIGAMIQGGLLGSIELIQSHPGDGMDADGQGPVKGKKIYYD